MELDFSFVRVAPILLLTLPLVRHVGIGLRGPSAEFFTIAFPAPARGRLPLRTAAADSKAREAYSWQGPSRAGATDQNIVDSRQLAFTLDEVTYVCIEFEAGGQKHQEKYSFILELHRSWAPVSYARFLKMSDNGFLQNQRFIRAIRGFVLDWNYGPQEGTDAAGSKMAVFYENELPWFKPNRSDRAAGGIQQKNAMGTIAFGQEDDGSTKSEVFINIGDNSGKLDSRGFWPFGRVVSRVENIQKVNFEYGDIFFPNGSRTPEDMKKAALLQHQLIASGSNFIDREYKGMSRIVKSWRGEIEQQKHV